MTISKKQIIVLISLLALIFALPVAILLTQKRQDIRPKALQGKANFLLSADSTTSSVGKNINVLVSLQVTDPYVRVSGVDFVLLYDKAKLDVSNIIPAITKINPNAPFTDAPIVSSGGNYDETYNFVRVTEIAKRSTDKLYGGTFSLAKITFRGKGEGQASVKFADDKYLEMVGIVTDKPWNPAITPAEGSDAILKLVPSTADIALSGTASFDLQASFPKGSTTQKLDYFKTEITFDKDILKLPDASYIDTSTSGFGKIFRVDGPTAANDAGKIIIELGAVTPGAGPASDKPITIAKINFQGIKSASGKNLVIGTSQVVDNKSVSFTVTSENATYSVK